MIFLILAVESDKTLLAYRDRLFSAMKLYYVHDPMCSWCWAFRPTWKEIVAKLPPAITPQRLLGGLAPDSDAPMPEQTRAYVQRNWRKIQQVVPDTRFNFDFWTRCQPRRSTYPACRAVIAATTQGDEYEEPMILAIQQAYYLHARNPSDDTTLIDLAEALGLSRTQFTADLNNTTTEDELARQIAFGQQIGAHGFPSLILGNGTGYRTIDYDYNGAALVLAQLP